jgi:opacity protein-like surface antigen
MKLAVRIGLVILSLLSLEEAGFSQGTPKAEIFGGYSFARQGDANIGAGWNGSVEGKLTDWFGIVADVSGHYYSKDLLVVQGPSNAVVKANLSLHMFRFGPQFTMRSGKAAPFVHALFGAANAKVTGGLQIGSANFSVSDSSTDFAAAVGGGVDVDVTDRFAIRAVQVDYSYFRNGSAVFGPGGSTNGVRISGGVVFRF